MTARIVNITHPDMHTVGRLLAIWESAVRATHAFLSEADIAELRPQVERALCEVNTLYGYRDAQDPLLGFMGIDGDMLEMLFIDDSARGTGVGGRLLRYAIRELGVRRVDVNEQNGPGVGFYEHMGFVRAGRSDTDGAGRPFPILHMRLPGEIAV